MPPSREPKDVSILIVDDEAALRKAIVFDFKRKGYNVFEAANGKEAFDVVNKNKIDVVLSDIRMPGGDGVELLDNIKAMDPRLPVVMLITGFADLSLEDAYDKGADAIFSKPFDRKALLSAVSNALEERDKAWQPKPEAERVKVDISMQLKFPELQQSIQGKLLNIGRGGIFVSLGEKVPEIDSVIQFDIQFEAGSVTRLKGEGRVRWTRPIETNGHTVGCGIEFIYLTDEVRGKIIKLIDELRPKPFLPKN